MGNKQKLKSISVLVPLQEVSGSISQLGFSLDGITTIVTEGKFWKKMLYVNGEETISVSEESDAYPKDPVITICGSNHTVSKVTEDLQHYAGLRM
ncbi:MAG: hypothetical protein WAM14_17490 [Candidatus Nitrosopolaris sp.]